MLESFYCIFEIWRSLNTIIFILIVKIFLDLDHNRNLTEAFISIVYVIDLYCSRNCNCVRLIDDPTIPISHQLLFIVNFLILNS